MTLRLRTHEEGRGCEIIKDTGFDCVVVYMVTMPPAMAPIPNVRGLGYEGLSWTK
jgi:hypothetical protein